MAGIRILSKEDIHSLFTLSMALEAVEQAYREKDLGQGQVWPMVFHEFDPGHADLDIKSGNLDGAGVFGLKVVSWYAGNPAQGLPALHGTSLLFDLATGAPKALLNAGPITDYRTGAAGALGIKYLARRDARRLLMVGCGALAPYLIGAALLARPDLEQIQIVNPHAPAHAEQRLVGITQTVRELLECSGAALACPISASWNIEQAVKESDIILTATPSYQPMIRAEWVRPGTHFSCVGSDMAGKQEIASDVFAGARVFCDDVGQCLSVGECEKPHQEGLLETPNGEIGAVINGRLTGRVSDRDITIFDSTGIALQDLASAVAILNAAEQSKKGILVNI